MSSGGGGTNTVVQNSAPPQQFLDAYQNAVTQAQQVASQPYVPYPGQQVAGLSPDQQQGISQIEGLQGISAPFINAAAQEIGNSTAPLLQNPQFQNYLTQATSGNVESDAQHSVDSIRNASTAFTPGGVQQWMNPYTQDVVNATQKQFANTNAQQQQQLAGNGISQGAFGGDRMAVAQAQLAGQQQAAQAPVIAGLYNQGYQTGLSAEQAQAQLGLQGATSAGQLGLQGATSQAQLDASAAQQVLGASEANSWLNSQAGYGLANLGNEALSSGLTGANALLGVGGLEQQQAQQNLNIPYEQYIAQQSYPFQTTGWLSGIAEGLGGASGGHSSTSSPGPNVGSQVLGAGLTGAGILGMTGAFGPAGYLTGAGGLLGSGAGAAAADTAAWDLAAGAGGAAAGGIGAAGAADAALAFAKDGGRIANDGIGKVIRWNGGQVPRRASGGVTVSIPQIPTGGGLSNFTAPNGVMIPQLPASGIGMGAAPSGGGLSAVNNYLAASAMPPPAPVAPVAPAAPAAPAVAAPATPPPDDPNAPNPSQVWFALEHQDSAGSQRNGGGIGHFDDGGDVGFSPDDDADAPGIGGPPAPPAAADIAPASAPVPAGGIGGGHGDLGSALLYTGLGIMGGSSPNFAENVGRGAMQGLKLYETNESRRQQAQALADYRKTQGQVAQARVQESQRKTDINASEAAARLKEMTDYHKELSGLSSQRLGIEAGHLGVAAAGESERVRHDKEVEGQGHYTWQPGIQTDDQGNNVQGSWRYSAKGDEAPTFFPGVVQQRTVNADQRQATQATAHEDRQSAQKALEDYRAQELKLRSQGMNANEINNTMNNAQRMVTGDVTSKTTLQGAVDQLTEQRKRVQPGAPPAAPALADPLGIR